MPDAKHLLVVVQRYCISHAAVDVMLSALTKWGFKAMIIRTSGENQRPVEVYLLDNLPQADLEQVQKLVEGAK